MRTDTQVHINKGSVPLSRTVKHMQFLVKLFRENHKIMCCLFFRAQKIWCEERHWVKYLLYIVVLNYWNSCAVWARVGYNGRKAANRSVWHFWTCSFIDFLLLLLSGSKLDEKTDSTDCQYKASEGSQLSSEQRLETESSASVKEEQNVPTCTSKSQYVVHYIVFHLYRNPSV